MGRASTPASDTVGELEGDDWLGSSSHVGPSEGTGPIHPSRAFHQNLRSVQELSEDVASASGEYSFCAHCVCLPKFLGISQRSRGCIMQEEAQETSVEFLASCRKIRPCSLIMPISMSCIVRLVDLWR